MSLLDSTERFGVFFSRFNCYFSRYQRLKGEQARKEKAVHDVFMEEYEP